MSQTLITQVGALTKATRDAINANFTSLFGQLFVVGNTYYCNPTTTVAVSQQDGSLAKPFSTLLAAYNACVSGHNDIVGLIGDGTTGATARVDAAFTWSKNATHLIGICSPVLFSQRARIAPTAATTAFANFFTISGNGCIFQNIQWFHGFNTGTTAEICMTVTGSRNYFGNCQIAGMGDTTGAADAGSRSLKIGSAGSGENVFENCVIGLDTVSRSAANASVELAGATPRNVFRRCIFPFMGTSASVLGILGTGAECVDRENYFQDCVFSNAIKSTSTQMTALLSFTNAAPGGAVVFQRCMMMGVTKFGDTNGLANSYIDMPAVSAAAGGLGINPT
jgi:hypothetical protein